MNSNRIGAKRKKYDDEVQFIKQESDFQPGANIEVIPADLFQNAALQNNFQLIQNSFNFNNLSSHHFINNFDLDNKLYLQVAL